MSLTKSRQEFLNIVSDLIRNPAGRVAARIEMVGETLEGSSKNRQLCAEQCKSIISVSRLLQPVKTGNEKQEMN